MTYVIRGDYGPIDLQAIAQWNRGVQRARKAYEAEPSAIGRDGSTCMACSIPLADVRAKRCHYCRIVHKRVENRARQQQHAAHHAKRMRAYRARKKRTA